MTCVIAGVVLGPITARRAAAQSAALPTAPATVVVTPGAHYRAGRLHRWLFGDHWRDLWTTPMTVEVLDLHTFAGGLRATRRGGAKETRSLRFAGGDGREYVFRSVDKDATPIVPPSMRGTIAQRLLQDNVSAHLPAGALAVAPLLAGTGVLHASPRLVVLPDDERLGEFRGEFAGILGLIEERPTGGDEEGAGFAGAVDVVGTPKLFERLRKSSSEQIDRRAFAAARLMDIFLGDWDRHGDQWRWAKVGSDTAPWLPIPRDRDMAFSKLDGVMLDLARGSHPELVAFKETYPSMVGLMWQSQALDRYLLVGLDHTAWDSIAAALQHRLSDSVIDAAVRELPKEYQPRHAAWLARALERRRDRLSEAARRFRLLLVAEADVHATDERDTADVVWVGGGAAEVSLRAGSAEPYFRQRFDPAETREVRLYLHGGDDRVVVRGDAAPGLTVRVIGGAGDDEVADSTRHSSGSVRFYDADGRDRLLSRGKGRIDRRPYPELPSPGDTIDPPRDWGRRVLAVPWISYGPDVGLFVGGGPVLYRYGFRQRPFAYRMILRAGYATGARRFRADYRGDFRRPNSRLQGTVKARASGLDLIRFHGFGNETQAPGPRSLYRVRQSQYSLETALAMWLSPHASLSLGPSVRRASTELRAGQLITRLRPYGSAGFGQVGGHAALALDTRDEPAAARRGVLFTLDGSLYPAGWDVEHTFGEVHAEAATYLTARIPTRPTLALRAGGKRVWGTYPFHEAAFLGGASTLRGWAEQRFAGDASLYGNAELRLFLTKFDVIVPGDLGIFGLGDIGRVYLRGESSDSWHRAVGGGIWVAPFSMRANTATVAVARGRERTGVYIGLGFVY